MTEIVVKGLNQRIQYYHKILAQERKVRIYKAKRKGQGFAKQLTQRRWAQSEQQLEIYLSEVTEASLCGDELVAFHLCKLEDEYLWSRPMVERVDRASDWGLTLHENEQVKISAGDPNPFCNDKRMASTLMTPMRMRLGHPSQIAGRCMIREKLQANGAFHCYVCEGLHTTSQCPIFQSMDIKQRKYQVRIHSACRVCLGQRHSERSCPGYGCFRCSPRWTKHHVLLCTRNHSPNLN